MTFEDSIRASPLRFEPGIPDGEAFPASADHPAFSGLAANAASSSPYLRSLIQADPEWALGLADRNPGETLAEILGQEYPGEPGPLALALRIAKKRVALLSALADLGGVWELEEVTAALTRFADLAVSRMLDSLVAEAAERKVPPRLAPVRNDAAHGMFVLAMGKMGAFELNYSSDIDLILLFDQERYEERAFESVRSSFIKVARRLSASLSDITAGGYVFRTDLRLRPDPLVTSVCMSMESAEHYYESFGRNWERGIFIKARPCAGAMDAGEKFLRDLSPFIWRKSLDFAAVRDARDMRHRNRESKRLTGRITLPGHDMKSGRGGIREIESFAQTFQIIVGGRDKDIRVPDTVGALEALSRNGWVPEETARSLASHYRSHRRLEHRLQMINDAQTHQLPRSDQDFARIAALCGESSVDDFRRSTLRALEEVHELTESFFRTTDERSDGASRVQPTEPELELLERWRKLPALRGERTKDAFRGLYPEILLQLRRADSPDRALAQFDGFLKGLPAGMQLFSLFEANPRLISLLTDICSTAPGLAGYLAKNSHVFDAVLGGEFFSAFPGAAELSSQIGSELGEIDDYEAMLNAARRRMHEQHFRIGVQNLRGMLDCREASAAYADLAEATIGGIYAKVVEHFAVRHGMPPGRGAAVIAMGSLGARSLTPQSDLDLIVLYDPAGEEASAGKKPLMSRVYYSRLTQTLVSALSAPTSEGKLYSVDMRLRPSGRQGPVAVTLHSFRHYQMDEAWTWEHLALTRARVVAGSETLGEEFEAIRRAVIRARGERSKVIEGLSDMRRRLLENADHRRLADPWEVRVGQGRLLDIELFAQAAALIQGSPEMSVAAQIGTGVESGWIGKDDAYRVSDSHATLKTILQVARLTSGGEFNPSEAGKGAVEFLLRETGEATLDRLRARVADDRRAVEDIISRLVD